MSYHVGKPRIFSPDILKHRMDVILESGQFGNNGKFTEVLEQTYCQLTGSKYAVAVTNATVGLELVISHLAQAKPKMRVAVPSFTFVASASCAKRFGHEIVLIDSDWDFNISLEHLEAEHSKKRIDLVIVPELFGNRMNRDLSYLSNDLGMQVIYDRAHAVGIPRSPFDGLAQVYSHHPTKLAGSFELGMVVTNNVLVADYVRTARNFGFDLKDKEEPDIFMVGTNAKVSEIAAAAGLTQLEDFEKIKEHYKMIYDRYNLELKNLSTCHVNAKNTPDSNYSYVTMFAKSKSKLQKHLSGKGIHTKSYFRPIHMFEQYLNNKVLFGAETLYRNTLTLPSGLTLEASNIKEICDEIKSFYAG